MILTPGTQAPIVIQLGMPGDTGTYYVQAVVRRSSTGATIATVNLTDQGNQRFTGSFDVPQDPLGFGYYLDVTISVYTDAGYTTLSNLYTIQENMYQVKLLPQFTNGGGGGGDYTDYKKIRKMIEEVVGKIEIKEVEMPEYKETDLQPVLSELQVIKSSITGVKGNVAPVGESIARMQKSIENQLFA